MVLGSNLGRGRGRPAAFAAVTVLLLTLAATACGDESGGGSDTPPPTPPTDKATSAPAEPSPSAPQDPAAAEKQVRRNWEKFFAPDVSLKNKEAVLENGPAMRQVLESFDGDKRGQQVQADVDKVAFTSATEADVSYALTLKGQTALPGASGTAVDQDGTWKVSVKTLCALVQLSGNESPGPGC